jgi:CRISPR/Cas system CMR-associated protein Cmr5 small subunit
VKNLEQIRAAHALPLAAKTTKADVNKLPAMIIASGLLAATAFAKETSDKGQYKRKEMKAVMDGVATHLASQGIASGATDSGSLIAKLAAAQSTELQRATAEALAFIGYVKRYAGKEVGKEK